jgi:phage major head subunit gpT-like protein
MNSRAQFQRLLFPGIKSVIMNSFNEKMQQFSKVGKVGTSSKAFEEDFTASGVGLFVQTPEGLPASSDQFTPGLSIRYTVNDFKLRIGFSEQAIRDMLVNLASDRAKDLGFSARQTVEVLFADIWNNGFTVNGYDGVPLFSAAHPNYRGSGVQSNLLGGLTPTPATLSVLSLRQALTQYRRFFDETGVRRIQVDPAMLVVPPEEWYNAQEIVKSSDRPDTANRAVNVVKGALEIVPYDYLTDINNWFVGPTQQYNRIKMFWRRTLSISTYTDEDTETNWVQAAFAYSQGWSGWLGWLGTNPV